MTTRKKDSTILHLKIGFWLLLKNIFCGANQMTGSDARNLTGLWIRNEYAFNPGDGCRKSGR